MNIHTIETKSLENSNLLQVAAEEAGKLVIKVLDVQGRIAKIISTQLSEGVQQLQLDLDDLSQGRYVLNAFSEEKFIKSIRFTKE